MVREKVVAEFDGRTSLKSPDIVFQLLQQFYKKVEGEEKEYAVVIHLDTKLKPLSLDIISIGSHQDAPVHPMQVFRKAVISGASSIIFAHNQNSWLSCCFDDFLILNKGVQKNPKKSQQSRIVNHYHQDSSNCYQGGLL
ncbi:MAG: JAB domain-containing protein [Anaerolineaceae bacterium]